MSKAIIKKMLISLILAAMLAISGCDGASTANEGSETGSVSASEGKPESEETDDSTTDTTKKITTVETTEETTEGENLGEGVELLRYRYPDYFSLDATNGLDVYVCQFASDLYYFHLFEHCDHETGIEYSKLIEAYKNIRLYADDMRLILETYDISPEDIHVIPWYHSASSYIGQYFANVGLPSDSKDAYIRNVRLMLLDGNYLSKEAHFSTYLCDIDNDGKTEICALGLGEASDSHTYTISAREADDTEPEYMSVIYHELTNYISIHGDVGESGIRISGQDINNKNKWHNLSVTFEDGKIHVWEDGVDLTN